MLGKGELRSVSLALLCYFSISSFGASLFLFWHKVFLCSSGWSQLQLCRSAGLGLSSVFDTFTKLPCILLCHKYKYKCVDVSPCLDSLVNWVMLFCFFTWRTVAMLGRGSENYSSPSLQAILNCATPPTQRHSVKPSSFPFPLPLSFWVPPASFTLFLLPGSLLAYCLGLPHL